MGTVFSAGLRYVKDNSCFPVAIAYWETDIQEPNIMRILGQNGAGQERDTEKEDLSRKAFIFGSRRGLGRKGNI